MFAQSDQIQQVLTSLGTQTTISDVDPSVDSLNVGPGMIFSPISLLLMFLASIWSVLYLTSASRNKVIEKPHQGANGDRRDQDRSDDEVY